MRNTPERRYTPTILHRTSPAQVRELDGLEFVCTAATSALADDGYALDMAGADLSRFRSGIAPLLFQHDFRALIGRIIGARTTDAELIVRARFASPGISPAADTARGLLKDGILNAVSIGFDVLEKEPLSGYGRTAWRATRWTAYETSLVCVGMDPAAMVTARALADRAGLSSPLSDAALRYRDPVEWARRHGNAVMEVLRRNDHGRRLAALARRRAYGA